MAQRYTKGAATAHKNSEYADAVNRAVKGYTRYMECFIIGGEAQRENAGTESENEIIRMVTGALGNIQSLASSGNRIIEQTKPWAVAKENPNHPDLPKFVYTWGELLRIIAILISPVLPKAAHGIFDQLNWKMELSGKEERFSLKDAEWGKLPDGHVVGKPVPLFPRIEAS